MLECRFNHAAAVLSERIYVVGGLDADYRYLKSAECYDPKTNAWTLLAPLNEHRGHHRCCVVSESLYVVGGYDGRIYLDTIERYDQKFNKWITVIRLNNRCV